jgi:hypothetical protein
MQFFCLAYGSEKDWQALTTGEQEVLLAQDEVLRSRGDLVAAVSPTVTVVRAWDGTPDVSDRAFAGAPAPLAGFGIIEAETLQHAIELVAQTPCARARGAVELRPITASNDAARCAQLCNRAP